MRLVLSFTAVLMLALASCGEQQQVGSERLLEDLDGGEGIPRLGERILEEDNGSADATPAPLTVEEEATPEPEPTPAPEPTYFEVSLIADSPFIAPGNRLITSTGVTIRVTNQDDSPERPERSFTAQDGSFDSGLLSPGDQWTWTFDSPGSWNIVDRAVPFISGTLEVQ